MCSKLNKDIIYNVLEHLRDDNSPLYSCLLINQTWCSIAIPMMWQTPFIRHYNSFKIIQTLISCLSEEEINLLMNKTDHSLDFITKPLFNYPSFIKEINFNNFEKFIELHYNFFYTNIPTNIDLEIFTIQLLGNMIFNNNKSFLKKLILNYNDKMLFKYKHYNCLENLVNFKGMEYSLKYLENLKLNLYFPRRILLNRRHEEKINYISDSLIKFFNNLSRITLNLKHLTIYLKLDGIEQSIYDRICESFSHLIQVQKNLSYLEINEFSGNSSLMTALRSQATSLTSLKINSLRDFYLLLSVLNTCTNLITLEITENFEIEQDITSNNLPPIHLENLSIYQIIISDNSNHQFITFIKSLLELSSNIKKLTLDFITFELLDMIKLYCSNSLEYFSLQIIPNDILKFCEILPSLRNLNSLIVIEWLCGDDIPISLEYLILLANSLPNSLKSLGIRIFCNPINLKKFLLNINVNLIELDIYRSLDDNFINAIIQYVLEKNINLKRLGYFNAFNSNFRISSGLMIKLKELIPIIEETRSIKHIICW